jgi:hypothetical protein
MYIAGYLVRIMGWFFGVNNRRKCQFKREAQEWCCDAERERNNQIYLGDKKYYIEENTISSRVIHGVGRKINRFLMRAAEFGRYVWSRQHR